VDVVVKKKPLPKKVGKVALKKNEQGNLSVAITPRTREYTEAELKAVFAEDVCHNPVKFLEKNCPECIFCAHCIFFGKDNYAYRRRRVIPERSLIPEQPLPDAPVEWDGKKKPSIKKESPAPKTKKVVASTPIPVKKKRMSVVD